MTATYVLVHGAWHGGWCWRPVAERMRAVGHRVLTPTLPGFADGDDPAAHGLDDVIDFVATAIETQDLSDVVLVGHSWGGYVVAGAAPRVRSRLRKLVFWSAFVPADGAALYDEVPPETQELFTTLARESGTNSVSLPFELWRDAFIQDAAELVQRLTHGLLVPQPMQYNTTAVRELEPDRLGIAAAYLLGAEDLTMPEGDAGWRRFAARLGVSPTVIPGSHELFFTQPGALAQALLAEGCEP
ncbi:alpha/beta hydrolase [Amycolatopsis rubida]|uniref:Alpha/beta hydrolase n=1 Tax=Amycolatopsis rubida TaxID=112413 RepID=A0ABX0C1X1_9PSEU|nr:alpha/beta hydrolase [Amycolatopsis sp. M39]MYW96172.1 alpha/beta fold hydrolase [Amycolatopsis rubida]NEC61163.1 alpha/beta hydrolase [Amycolatopsis rubida]OAP24312.1 Pyrethroid hydrolase [Amycolatopsis sp. M39]